MFALVQVLASLALAAFEANPSPIPPPFAGPGVAFASIFTDHAVLQRAPDAAALYGVVIDEQATGVNVTITADGGSSYTVSARHFERVNATYARWKAVLNPTASGDATYTAEARCRGCSDSTVKTATVRDIVFGEVWVCSGQSNMWLPMHFTLSRNRTYDALRDQTRLGKRLKNIRMFTVPQNLQPDSSLDQHYDSVIGVPPPPYDGTAWNYPGGGWLIPNVGSYPDGPATPDGHFFNNTVASFAATCWYYAQGLAELAEAQNESVVPFGLISSSWGGTVVEAWTPNATLQEGACSYVSGNATHDWAGATFGPRPGGSLYNGMIAPFVNFTIRGAVWYQGENNVFQCPPSAQGDPDACGHAGQGTGYGCFLRSMLRAWRHAWADAPLSATSRLFPFGIVTLAGGTSEDHSAQMPAFRNAQTAGGGLLPNSLMPATFVAQAFDAGEPSGGEGVVNSCQRNDETDEGGYPCAPGYARHTPYFMGGIHPRTKRVVGRRLAVAARALVYEDRRVVWTGPVLVGCKMEPDPYPGVTPDPKHSLPMVGPRLRLMFNATLLSPPSAITSTTPNTNANANAAANATGPAAAIVAREGDTLSVRQPGWELALHGPPNPHTPYPMSIGARGQPFAALQQAGLLTVELLQILAGAWRPGAPGGAHDLLYTSPLEVRYGGSRTNLSDGGVWLSARLFPLCYGPASGNADCGWNETTGARLSEWNVATAALPLGRYNASEVTAVRYAWREDPCCPGVDRSLSPCPPGSCPIQGYRSALPAVPFLARINPDTQECDWNSIHDPPLN